jgi:hypothetical protein
LSFEAYHPTKWECERVPWYKSQFVSVKRIDTKRPNDASSSSLEPLSSSPFSGQTVNEQEVE